MDSFFCHLLLCFIHLRNDFVPCNPVSEIHKAILRLFADPVEKCRELSATYVGEILRKTSRPEVHLPYVIPTLVERLGGKEIVEACEEIRLQLVDMLVEIVERVGNQIAPYIDDVVKVTFRSFPLGWQLGTAVLTPVPFCDSCFRKTMEKLPLRN